jgi:hypothetical protein
MLQLFRFVVLEHFKQHDCPCHELATDFFAELSWASVARRLQVRHNTVIKRCRAAWCRSASWPTRSAARYGNGRASARSCEDS